MSLILAPVVRRQTSGLKPIAWAAGALASGLL